MALWELRIAANKGRPLQSRASQGSGPSFQRLPAPCSDPMDIRFVVNTKLPASDNPVLVIQSLGQPRPLMGSLRVDRASVLPLRKRSSAHKRKRQAPVDHKMLRAWLF